MGLFSTNILKFDFITSSLTILTLLGSYYVFFVAGKPQIHAGHKKLKAFVENHIKSATSIYWPALFYFEGRLQTVFGLIKRFPANHKLDFIREILTLKDGGEIALDYMNSDVELSPGQKRQIVLFMPGLTSSSQTSYVKSLALAITSAGANIIIFNNRGIGGISLKTPRSFCAVNIEDLLEVIQHLKKKYPGEKFVTVGTSFGTILFGQYLTQYPKEAKSTFIAALFISSVFDAVAAQVSLESSINNLVLNKSMAGDLIQRTKRFEEQFQVHSWFDMTLVSKCRSVRDYDRVVTVPQFGLASVEEYYEKSSTINHLHKLSVPVINFNAWDDPLQPGECLPFDEAEKSTSKLVLITTKRGGHLGFLEGFLPISKSFHFLERFTIDFMQAVIHHRDELESID